MRPRRYQPEIRNHRVERIPVAIELALDIGHDVHDLAEALDQELIGDRDGGCARYATDVVAAEIEQHQMLGALLRIRE